MRKLLTTAAAIAGLLAVLLWLAASLLPGQSLEYRSEVRIELPAGQTWEKMKDLSCAHEYVPGVLRTEITTTARGGLGASRRVYSSDADFINETAIEWHEGVGFTLDLHDGDGVAPAPFEAASFRYELQPEGENASLVSTSLRFTLRGGAVGEWLGMTVLAGVFQDRVDAVSAGLKRYYEAGPL